MKVVLICLCALLMNRFLGEPRRWNPLIGFDWLAQRVEAIGYGPVQLIGLLRWLLGTFVLMALVIPPALIVWRLSSVPYLYVVVEVSLLYLTLDIGRLRRETGAVAKALKENNLAQARKQLERLVNRDTASMDEEAISLATVEAILVGGYSTMTGALFWFLVAGAPGAVVYRLVGVLKERWGYPTPRYGYFGWSTMWLYYALNWIPARLTAFAYLLLGDHETAWRCWRRQASAWRQPNAGSAIAAGAGALNLQLGGMVYYYGRLIERPSLGEGILPRAKDISRSLNLLDRSLGLGIAFLFLGGYLLT